MVETLAIMAFEAGAVGSVGAAASLASGASSIGTLLSVGSAVSSIAGGFSSMATSKAQARQSELAARQEELRGRETANNIRRGLSATLASQNAIFAARGINPMSGTPKVIGQESRSQAARDVDIARFGAEQSAGALRAQGQQYKTEGRAAMVKGFGTAITSLVR